MKSSLGRGKFSFFIAHLCYLFLLILSLHLLEENSYIRVEIDSLLILIYDFTYNIPYEGFIYIKNLRT